MAKSHNAYIWRLAVENLTAEDLEQCAKNALASLPPWEADDIRKMMKVPQEKIRYFGPGSAAELFMALGLWAKGQEL